MKKVLLICFFVLTGFAGAFAAGWTGPGQCTQIFVLAQYEGPAVCVVTFSGTQWAFKMDEHSASNWVDIIREAISAGKTIQLWCTDDQLTFHDPRGYSYTKNRMRGVAINKY
ncbi:MAG: hypothetical protein JW768_05055 [Chitinispirillaceae bacterium]|nr:hypothetical protein [Chitinispirillaceae bacterium]